MIEFRCKLNFWSYIFLSTIRILVVFSILLIFLETSEVMVSPSMMTLLNINAAAKYLPLGYNGPTLDLASKPDLLERKIATSSSKLSLNKVIFEAFHSLASPPNFLWQDINTTMGFAIDAETVFDAKTAKPLGPIKELGLLGRQSFLSENLPPEKALPEGAKRVAILVVSYNESLTGNKAPLSGITDLKMRLLKARGYNVMLIKYDDLSPKLQKLQKVKLLEAKLRSVLE